MLGMIYCYLVMQLLFLGGECCYLDVACH